MIRLMMIALVVAGLAACALGPQEFWRDGPLEDTPMGYIACEDPPTWSEARDETAGRLRVVESPSGSEDFKSYNVAMLKAALSAMRGKPGNETFDLAVLEEDSEWVRAFSNLTRREWAEVKAIDAAMKESGFDFGSGHSLRVPSRFWLNDMGCDYPRRKGR